MKLISLYIENFGGLSQYALDFQEGLTVIEEANGFGKTTLAEFIRAMFYGFPRKAKTLDKSRRQKYTPWNGGKFGGNLVFESEGCRYRVERSFGATPKSDSFTLIDLNTGKKSNRYTEELGLELFQLDADSFERSTYLPQLSDDQTLTTDSIHSKLSNLVEDTNDVGNYEKAVAALRAKRSALLPYRGNGGSIMQSGSNITRLQEQLKLMEKQQDMLGEVKIGMDTAETRGVQLKQQRDALRQEIRQVSEAVAITAVYGQYDRLLTRKKGMEQELARFREAYPKGIPEAQAIETARQAAAQLEILDSRKLTQQEDREAMACLEENRSRFEKHIPTEKELENCRNWCETVSDLREQAMELAAQLTLRPDVKVNPTPLILLLVLGMVGIALGVVLLAIAEPIWGYVAMGIGGIGLIGAIFAGVRLHEVREALQAFRQKREQSRKKMEQLTAQADQLTVQIEEFLSTYVSVNGADHFGLLAQLEHSREDYLQAQERVTQWQREMADHEAEVARWNGVLDIFFESHGLIRQTNHRRQLLQIRDDRKDWEEAIQENSQLLQEMENFRQEHQRQLEQPRPETAADLEELQQQEAELAEEMNSCDRRMLMLRQQQENLMAQLGRIPELRDELQQWQEKKLADQKKSDLLDHTMTLLEQAKENLSGNYLAPIRKSFAEYLAKIWPEQEGQILVTPELEVQLERFGAVRELGYFSAGQTDAVMLSMRLALVDALFGEERPIVILDDPFINLDDSRTEQALQLLKDLAEERQILYLTCNSSRVPK